jgi:hypothetical protein
MKTVDSASALLKGKIQMEMGEMRYIDIEKKRERRRERGWLETGFHPPLPHPPPVTV